jgi:pheromone shutdown protein TraB
VGFALALYAIGVAAGLVLTDARPLARVSIALLWPLAIVTFAVTIATLVAAAMLIFPSFGALVLAAALAGWFWLL